MIVEEIKKYAKDIFFPMLNITSSEKINKDNLEFNGVIYGGFFKTKNGIKFIEFNSRFGDPEALNVLNSLETPFTEVMKNIFNKHRSDKKTRRENIFCKYKTFGE